MAIIGVNGDQDALRWIAMPIRERLVSSGTIRGLVLELHVHHALDAPAVSSTERSPSPARKLVQPDPFTGLNYWTDREP